MSFSAKLKRELLSIDINEKELIYSELFGILSSRGKITSENIYFSTENVTIAKRVYSNLKKITDLYIYLTYKVIKKIHQSNIYEIKIIKNDEYKEKYDYLLKELYKFKNLKENINEENISSIIRGYFMSSGYIKSPEKEYSLDFFLYDEDSSRYIHYLLKKIGKKVFKTKKGNQEIVYIRNVEDILDVIVLMGGINSFFEYEEVTINKEIRNNINRNINCEIANETKKISTSERQIKMINEINEKIGLENLSSVLREVAELRLKNEDASLQELSNLIGVTKSAVSGRFKRLENIYNELKEKDKEKNKK